MQKLMEIYKCAILTVIAFLLASSIWLNTPLRVRVAGGIVDVNVVNTVDVDVINTVDVDGTVSIRR